jgi:hypothetical protein
MTKQPTDVQAIYDTGPDDAIDRYTVVLNETWEANPGELTMLGLSSEPAHPQGFSQFTAGIDGPHLGRTIEWADMPENVREHIARRLAPA